MAVAEIVPNIFQALRPVGVWHLEAIWVAERSAAELSGGRLR
jgi:hypothetical protein